MCSGQEDKPFGGGQPNPLVFVLFRQLLAVDWRANKPVVSTPGKYLRVNSAAVRQHLDKECFLKTNLCASVDVGSLHGLDSGLML